jgi:TRAP-type C4-dicarboxylate transport system substrate-binding protein
MMNKFNMFLSGAALAISGATAGFAQETLTISSWAPPSHGMNAMMFPKLIEMIEEVTDGQVTGEIKYGLAPPPAQMDIIMDGGADITWIFHGYTPGRFVGTKLIELPGYEGNAAAASVAHWRVHKAHLEKLDEHRGVKVIALMTHGVGQLHTNKDITSLADINGLKTRIGGGVAGDVGAELGMVGIRVPAPKVYETLDSGAADAVAMPVEGRASFKLTEVARNLYEMPGGLYRGSFAVIMNQDKFDSLPAEIQAKLESEVFGERVSRMAGEVWDEIDAVGRKATEDAADNKIIVASAADQEAFGAIVEKIRTKVLAELDAAGVDAQSAYDMVKAEMAAATN